VAQWFWLRETHRGADQFNSIHERLIAAWRKCRGRTVHFSGVSEHAEDEMTVLYLRDTCEQAGVRTKPVFIQDIGWDEARGVFVDLDLDPSNNVSNSYPWGMALEREFAAHLSRESARGSNPRGKCC